jgi:UDP-2,4-diacetamido-2,4,6-trideoxy-beta-L-altropyranose hydrolase
VGIGTILIRADASHEIGTGHVMRCLALAQTWQDAGGAAVFLMAETTPAITARLAAENCELASTIHPPGSHADADYTRVYAGRQNVEWIVIDGYRFDAEYQRRLRSALQKLLCVDDEGKCEFYAAEIVLNQNATASDWWYRRCLPETRRLLGPRFCLLRREFAKWRGWRREIPRIGRNVLVTLGGSTPVDIAARVMASLNAIEIEGLNITVAVGGSGTNIEDIDNLAAKLSRKIAIRKDVCDMSELISQADVAISAAGSTSWELCFLGTPSVLLDVASNQTSVALELDRQGCARYLGRADSFDTQKLASMVQELLASQEMRQSLAMRSQQLVDGAGAERVVYALQSFDSHPVLASAGGAHT